VALAGLLAAISCASAQSVAIADQVDDASLAFAKASRKAGKKAAHKSKKKKDEDSGETASRSRHGEESAESTAPASLRDVSAADIALVRKAMESLRRSPETATQIESTISDPAARKLVEWLVLRSGNRFRSSRYLAFIAANPGWPSLSAFRRYAEEMLWVEDVKPAEVLRFFKNSPPQSARGRLALARALYALGDIEAARTQVRTAWRNDSMSAELEQQVLKSYSELLAREDHKARMERRLGAGEKEAALRAAHRLGGAQVAIARARIALSGKSGKSSKPLDGVPAEAHDDPGYILARVHVLRHQDKIAQAAQALLSLSSESAALLDPEESWVERRLLARKLLDIGDARSAYLAVRETPDPLKENSRVERLFMAGWIALRYLDDPASAAEHFLRIQDVSFHPTSLARSHYWLGRTAEALHQPQKARAEYEAAARFSMNSLRASGESTKLSRSSRG
jgi:soluble lytic murein transglycosylase